MFFYINQFFVHLSIYTSVFFLIVLSHILVHLLVGTYFDNKRAQYQDPENDTAKWNSAIVHFNIYICAFPTCLQSFFSLL